MKLSRWLAVAVVIGTGMALAGCDGDSNANNDPFNTPPGGTGGLSDVIVESRTITFSVWDCGALVDGDQIDLIINGEYYLTDYVLTGARMDVVVELNRGNNTVVVHADNEGTSEPNTACLQISDTRDEGAGDQEWSIYQGEDASLVVAVPWNAP